MAPATSNNDCCIAACVAFFQWLMLVLVVSVQRCVRFCLVARTAFSGIDTSFSPERDLEAGVVIAANATTTSTQGPTEIGHAPDDESIEIVIIPTATVNTNSETPSVLPQVEYVSAESNTTATVSVRDSDGENDDEVIEHLASESIKDGGPAAESKDADVVTAESDGDEEDGVKTGSAEVATPESSGGEEGPAIERADAAEIAAESESEEDSEEAAEHGVETPVSRHNFCATPTSEDDGSDIDTVTDSSSAYSSESDEDESRSSSDMDVDENAAEEDREIVSATTTAATTTAAELEDLQAAALRAKTRELSRRLREVQSKALKYTESPEYKLMRAESLVRRAKAKANAKPRFR
ncbi:hypothetical protein Gpo141_00014562 [Globisporangium polare]